LEVYRLIKLADSEKIIAKGELGFKTWEGIGMIFLGVCTLFLIIPFYIDYSRTKSSEIVLTNRRLIGKLRTGAYGYKLCDLDIPLEEISKIQSFNKFGMNGVAIECGQGTFVCNHILNIKSFSASLFAEYDKCKQAHAM